MGEKSKGNYSGYTEARKAANARYEAYSVERISLVLPKGKKAIIAEHANESGLSVNKYINNAIDEKIERDTKVEQ